MTKLADSSNTWNASALITSVATWISITFRKMGNIPLLISQRYVVVVSVFVFILSLPTFQCKLEAFLTASRLNVSYKLSTLSS